MLDAIVPSTFSVAPTQAFVGAVTYSVAQNPTNTEPVAMFEFKLYALVPSETVEPAAAGTPPNA